MKNTTTSQRRQTGKRRYIAETLESRWLFTATPSLNISALAASYHLTNEGNATLAVDHDGTVWSALNDSLVPLNTQNVTPAVAYLVPVGSAVSTRNIVSNVVFTADNSAWFAVADDAGNQLEQLTSAGQFQDTTTVQSDAISNLTVSNNTVWFTFGDSAIGHLTTDGQKAIVNVPGASDLSDLTAGPDGNLWFTGTSASSQGMVGRITPEGNVKTYSIATLPSSITAGGDGALYVGGTDAIWRVATSGAMKRISLAGVDAQDLTHGPDGSIWFLDERSPAHPISRLGTDGKLLQFATGVPGEPMPNSLVVAPDGKPWFAVNRTGGAEIDVLNVAYVNSGLISAVTFSQASGVGQFMTAAGNATFVVVGTETDSGDGSTQTTPATPATDADAATASDSQDSADAGDTERKPAARSRRAAAQDTSQAPGAAPFTAARNTTNTGPAASGTAGAASAYRLPDDPGTFEGEFSIGAYAPPRRHPVPVSSSPDDDYAAGAAEPRALARASTTNGLEPEAASAKGQAPAGQIAPAVGPTRAADEKIATGPHTVQRTEDLHPLARLQMAAAAGETPSAAPNGALAKWLKLTAYMSAATGLHMWRRGSMH